jgi:hypothetical protein
MSDAAVMGWLGEKLNFLTVQFGSGCEQAQGWEVGGSSLEPWQAEQRIHRLNVESSYDGVASLALQLK